MNGSPQCESQILSDQSKVINRQLTVGLSGEVGHGDKFKEVPGIVVKRQGSVPLTYKRKGDWR